jgi:hypothetical protein
MKPIEDLSKEELIELLRPHMVRLWWTGPPLEELSKDQLIGLLRWRQRYET